MKCEAFLWRAKLDSSEMIQPVLLKPTWFLYTAFDKPDYNKTCSEMEIPAILTVIGTNTY